MATAVDFGGNSHPISVLESDTAASRDIFMTTGLMKKRQTVWKCLCNFDHKKYYCDNNYFWYLVSKEDSQKAFSFSSWNYYTTRKQRHLLVFVLALIFRRQLGQFKCPHHAEIMQIPQKLEI